MKNELIAVTGLGRGESPQPGFAVAASLRRRWPDIRVAGLAYDAMESGLYCDILEAAFTLPYPSCGPETLLARVDEIRRDYPFTILIPTLDAELEPFIAIRDALSERGVRAMLPSRSALRARSKARLPELAAAAGVPVPRTFVVNDAREAIECAMDLPAPVMLKGPYYEAYRADSPHAAGHYAARLLAEWGGPVLVQECITGEEFDFLAVGDGCGGMLGSCAIRKLVVSARGKGYAGITVDEETMTKSAAAVIRELDWRGPLELEFLRDAAGTFHLIEINPRFPAWADFPAALGCNLAAAALQQTAGVAVDGLSRVPAGRVFLRHSVDLVCDALEFGSLAAEGRVIRNPVNRL